MRSVVAQCARNLITSTHNPTYVLPAALRHLSDTSGDNVLAYWQHFLNRSSSPANDTTAPPVTTDHISRLLQEAVRVHKKGSSGGVLPDEITDLLVRFYRHALAPEQRHMFFSLLCKEFGASQGAVDAAARAWLDLRNRPDATPENFQRAAQQLHEATQPLYMQLLLPIAQRHHGIHFLVGLRAHLLKAVAQQPAYAGPLRELSEQLRAHLGQWFGAGLLRLERVRWESSSAALLEKVMRYEAVHKVASWEDMKQRLGNSRRVFAFFHPSLPDEPLVILHTAITTTIADNMPGILGDPQPEAQPSGTVAMFYSISSTQAGLSGVDLGKLLIKRVVEALRAELPQLQHYVTLSPIPNFAAWLTTHLAKGLAAPAAPHAPAGGGSKAAAPASADVPLLQPQEVQALLQLQHQLQQQGSSGLPAAVPAQQPDSDAAALQLLQWLLQDGQWLQLPAAEPVLRPLLLRLCARYLTQEKRRGSALDPVAHFHLRNGAILWRLNWRADLSPAGLKRSHGLMVNYKYELDEVHGNNRAYVVDQRVCASQQVMELLGPQ